MTIEAGTPIEQGVFGHHPVDIQGAVSVKDDVYTRGMAAEYGVWQTYTFGGTETNPVPICNRDQYRSRVLVMVQVAGTGGFVNIGSLNQFSKAGSAQGGRLFNNANFEIIDQQAHYILPDGTNAATVTVLIERYDAYPDEPVINMGGD